MTRVCADCGAPNPELVRQPDGLWVCRHRRACEARRMLASGVSAHRAAAHAQGLDKPSWLTRLRRWYVRGPVNLDKAAEDMYYEQADRDGVDYPPPFRGR